MPAADPFPGFRPAALTFLRGLARHNTRDWFEAHRDAYEREVKRPLQLLVEEVDAGHGVGGRTHGGAGFYVQIAPGDSFVAAGIWMPATETLRTLRDHVASDHATLRTILRAPALRRHFGPPSEEGMLRRVPRGVTPGHAAAELLRYRSYMVSAPLTPEELSRPRLPDLLARRYATALPLVRWLNAALALPPATRR